MKRFSIFGSRFLFWLLAPWVMAGALFFPYLAYQSFLTKETFGVVVASVLFLICLSFLLMAISPKRFGGLSLFISGSIAGAYVWYFCDTFFVQHQALEPSLAIGRPTPFNAVLGFLFWGLPSTIYTVRGIKIILSKRRAHGTGPVAGTDTDWP